MKTLLGALGFLFLSSVAHAKMEFRYEPNEGGDFLECTHKKIRDLPDWDIVCGPKGEKKFSAHVIVRPFFRESAPQTTVEILYWVIEPGKTPTSVHTFHSSTFMVRLKEKTDLYSVSLSQGVENDYASLVLHLEGQPE